MMSVRKTPWHSLGNVLPEYPKSKQELLEAAGLDWSVGEFPVFVEAPDGTRIQAEDKKGIVRLTDNTLLSVMGGSYMPIQPSTLVDFAYALLEAEDGVGEDGQPAVLMETAISLAGGRVNTLLARIPEQVQIGGKDAIDLYLSFVNSHDGSLRLGVHVTPIRVECMNLLNLSLRTAQQSWTCKHSASAMSRIEEARKTLGLTFKYMEAFQSQMDALLDAEYTKAEFEGLVRDLWPKPANEPAPFSREQYAMIGLLESSPTISDDIRGTKWAALNAVTEHFDYGTRFNEGGAPVEEKRLQHVLFGKAKQQADRTLSYLS
jgi:phage/plasmid-like protein (TIGR03299 family)